MIKAFFFIFDPKTAWDGVAEARRRIGSIATFYLLPMMLIVAVVEGIGLVTFGRARPPFGEIRLYSVQEAIQYEGAQMVLMALVILLSTFFLKALGETFHGRHSYRQAFTVIAYGMSPIFMMRLLDVIPSISLWIFWVLGVILMAKILYIGVPRIMEPDPPHAFGLFFMTALLITMATAGERALSIGYLAGKFTPFSDVMSRAMTSLLHKFHLGQ